MNCITEEFPQPWSNKINGISELSKPLNQSPWNMLHIRDPGMTLGGRSPSPGTDVVRMVDAASSPLSPFLPDTGRRRKRRKKKMEKIVSSAFPYSSTFATLINGPHSGL